MAIRVDEHEIDETAELLAVLRGTRTYQARRVGFSDWVLVDRWVEHIRAGRQWPIYPKHVCGIEWPRAAVTHPELVPKPLPPYLASDIPPF